MESAAALVAESRSGVAESSMPIRSVDATAEAEPPKPKPRPIIRVGLFLVSHSVLVSVLCCIAGVLALLLLPVLAKNTYISENALMPGSASPMLSTEDVSEASRFVNEIISLDSGSFSSGAGIPGLIRQHIAELGVETNYHNFQVPLNKFHPLQFFSSPEAELIQENYSCSSYGVNTVGIVRAPRGDGKEAIVLVTPYNSLRITAGEALSLGIAYSVFSLLTRVSWLAKDIIWLAADSQHGEYTAVVSWLRDYHSPLFSCLHHSEICSERSTHFDLKTSPVSGSGTSDHFRRAGTMAAALVIKVADGSEEGERDALNIYAEASNGQMPNLDLINVVNILAVHGQGFRVKVEKLFALLDFWWLNCLGELFESLGQLARTLNPQWKFGIPVSEYVEGATTLASSLYNQAIGIPTGSHGAFRDYQVDAVTIDFSLKPSTSYRNRQLEFLLRCGRLIEGVIRSVNNLLEKFHQSFFLYLLTSPNKFVSVGVYMIAFALLVASLPLVSASLYSKASEQSSSTEKDKAASVPASDSEPSITFTSWKWLHAVKIVFVFHLWGTVVAMLPYFLPQVPNSSPLNSLLIWIALSVFTFLVLQLFLGSSPSNANMTRQKGTEWALLKSVTIAAAFTGLCLMSVINFATAEIGALLLVPMCLAIVPFRHDAKVKMSKAYLRGTCNLALLFLGFPPVAFFLLKGALEGYENTSVGDFWIWIESLWAWSSATYIYVCTVHLPCWVLCIYLLLYSC